MFLLFSIAISIYIVPYLVGRAGRYNEKGVGGSELEFLDLNTEFGRLIFNRLFIVKFRGKFYTF